MSKTKHKQASVSKLSIPSLPIRGGKEPLLSFIRRAEKSMFQELEGRVCYAHNDGYVYYGAAWHAQTGLIDEGMIASLCNGKRMLSVGAGVAYLEQILVRCLGIPRENLVLADIKDILPQGFNRLVFDMYGPWPKKTRESFDYVIFPESILLVSEAGRSEVERASRLLQNSISTLKAGGQIRIGSRSDIGPISMRRIMAAWNKIKEDFPGVGLAASPWKVSFHDFGQGPEPVEEFSPLAKLERRM
jgi:hypothetical protein